MRCKTVVNTLPRVTRTRGDFKKIFGSQFPETVASTVPGENQPPTFQKMSSAIDFLPWLVYGVIPG
jgi:hypothetical protein